MTTVEVRPSPSGSGTGERHCLWTTAAIIVDVERGRPLSCLGRRECNLDRALALGRDAVATIIRLGKVVGVGAHDRDLADVERVGSQVGQGNRNRAADFQN